MPDLSDLSFALPESGLITPAMLALALILDWVIGDMRWFHKIVPHPVVLIGNLIKVLEKKLNRESRSGNARIVRGLLVTMFVVGLSGLCGGLIHYGLAMLPYGWLAEIFLIATLLAGRSLFTHVGAVAKGLATGGLKGGREAVSHIVGRDPNSLDEYGVARSAIESLAENYADGVVAPAFWYLVFGLPGILGYKAVNTLDSMIGYRNKRYKDFGMAAAKLDDVANWIPARLSGLILTVGAFAAPKANPFRAIKIIVGFAGKHASPNAGWPEGAMAGALDFALGGPRKYPGGISEAAWIGSGRARLKDKDIRSAQWLYAAANLVQLILVGGLVIGWALQG
ncbi:adenosylcobinamide-phosphate synthase CbiB [Aestuariispira insulae]|uniref:Cobalamin biosynthesis protein CobD n=1 Tax=Aestuariispira insulae TaxID=1461337 RepID=A0A3D9HP06_9PROT|nr:adenosylcobinamide-phosphate synthase CbiB [Aestuariispira insulae]RED51220.1 adenosylcobinamide-phosphate synthase [Aestuariispira insulae]